MPAISQLNFLQSLGWALINSLWQMALLWIIYKFILSLSTQMKAGKKTTLATLLVTAGFAWFLFTFISTLFFKVPGDLYNNWIGLINEKSQTLYLGKILSAGTTVYLTLLVIPVWKFFRNYQLVQNIRTKGIHKINAEWKIFVRNTAEILGIVKKVQIWISDLVQSPVTVGFLKPVILLPVAAINQLTTQQIESIILHELYHIRRYDYLINLVINFIKTILYFNPFVKLFVTAIERERENSCDEMVIQYQYQPAEYASALLMLGKNKEQMIMAASGKNKDLLQRVEAILGIHKKRAFSFRQISISFITLLFIVFMNVFFFSNSTHRSFNSLAFTSDVNPYYFLNSKSDEPVQKQTESIQKEKQKNNLIDLSATIAKIEIPDEQEIAEPFKPAMSSYYAVNYTSPVIPELAKEDEFKLKETIVATKKILEEKEWKELERSAAEVYNSFEKERLKNEYQKEVNKIDWNKLEEQLKLSYNNINWEKVNDQISLSLAQIKLDSIQHQVSLTLSSLLKLETWMKENKTTSIPDSDITLKSIIENQLKAKAKLENIRMTRNKKIVKI